MPRNQAQHLEKMNESEGQIFQRKAEVNNKVYPVEAGSLRRYAIGDKGSEPICPFASEGWVVAGNVACEACCAWFIDAIEDPIFW
jgi:hypothetical protein